VEIHRTYINGFWGFLIVEELVRNNVNYFCISPGSRSTPLTLAAANNRSVISTICLDERGAAFHALGYARATGNPAVLICTSGTAAANYLPAIIEAHQSNSPLIVLTADRPPELREAGANQTIDQTRIYSDYINWQFELPCPDEKIPAQMVLTTVDQTVYRARRSPSGPVHLNCMFREPLESDHITISVSYLDAIRNWEGSGNPYTLYQQIYPRLSDNDLTILANKINGADNGILVAGSLSSEEAEIVLNLTQILGWPVFADITSGMRTSQPESAIINYFDQLLLLESIKKYGSAEIIIHFGPPLTSKRYLNFIKEYIPDTYIVIENHPNRHDPQHIVTERYEMNTKDFCKQIIPLIKKNRASAWLKELKQHDIAIERLIEEFIKGKSKISEISVARIISQNIPQDHGLFIASSMPIRDMDMYSSFNNTHLHIASNRGASGIDGTISTALGYACGLKKPATVLLGDLALIHDLNSLSQISETNAGIIIVVINNHGGGIFSFLPIAKFSQVFDRYFATPHDFSFENVANMFKLDYETAAFNDEFVSIYRESVKSNNAVLIEVVTERESNIKLHQELQKKICTTINQLKV
jgi:2-succinyl-5-enolpyruvyl-6-hydroxy-3-cyclohexene-1-carboxylate synthase